MAEYPDATIHQINHRGGDCGIIVQAEAGSGALHCSSFNWSGIMGMDLTVYVGPYLSVPRDSGFDWMLWDSVVCDGRGEAGVGEQNLILIPNKKLEGVERAMHVDRHGEQQMAQINPATIVKESAAFSRLASEVIQWFNNREIEIHEAWGVIPCWS